jgi:Pullulanase X25 domain
MSKRIFSTLAAALGVVILSASAALAGLAVPGNYQSEGGYGNDWTPADAPYMTDMGGGIFELPLSGLTGAVSLSRFNFKILDDGGTPPAQFGTDPEVPNNGPGSPDNWFVTNATGSATITLDRNTYNDGFFPTHDRISVSTDATEFSNYYATGNWMDEAGGAGDWNAGDPLFAMTDQGGGLWSVDATISTPGTYQFKATANGIFDFQWGTNGRLNDSANLQFVTVAPNQDVTFMLDVSKGAIAYSTDTFLDGDTDNDGVVEFEDDFFPIRDHWLESTFLRADGNLDNTGDSEGIVDITDFRQWKNACTLVGCATPAGMAAAFASLGASTVPEPSSLVIAIIAGMWLMTGARKRQRQMTSLTECSA